MSCIIKLKLNPYMKDHTILGWETIELLALVPNVFGSKNKKQSWHYLVRFPGNDISYLHPQDIDYEIIRGIYVDSKMTKSQMKKSADQFKKDFGK